MGNSQQTTALIKCTLFPASENLLKLLEVPYLLLLITNGALYAEDQWKNCASVKCPEALETEDVTASQHSRYFRDFEDLVTAWIPPNFEVLPFAVKRIRQNYPYLLSLKAGAWQKESIMQNTWATRLGDMNCVIAFFIKIKGHLCLSPHAWSRFGHGGRQRKSIATAEPMPLCQWYPHSLITQPFLHVGFQSGCTPEPAHFSTAGRSSHVGMGLA